MSEDQKAFFGGKPLELDVQLLEEAFGQPERGTQFTYGQIGEVTGEHYGTSRFEGVLDAWRRRVLEQFGVASRRVPGEAVRFLREDERSAEDIKDLRFHTRRVLKTTADLHRVDRGQLTGEALTRHEHATVIAAKLEAAALPAYKALEPPAVRRTLPVPAI